MVSPSVSPVATLTVTVASANSTISAVNNAAVVKIYFGRCSLVASTISMGAVWLLVIILVVIILKSALSMSAAVFKRALSVSAAVLESALSVSAVIKAVVGLVMNIIITVVGFFEITFVIDLGIFFRWSVIIMNEVVVTFELIKMSGGSEETVSAGISEASSIVMEALTFFVIGSSAEKGVT